MKAALIVLLGVVLVGVRIWRHRYARKKLGAPDEGTARARRRRGDVELIARREVHERVTSRVFRVGTIIVLLGVAAAVVVPVVRKGGTPVARVGVVGPDTALVRGTLRASGEENGVLVRIRNESSVRAAEQALRSGRIGLAVVDDRYLVVDQGFAASDTSSLALFAHSVARYLGVEVALRDAGVAPARIGALTSPAPLPIASLKPARHHSANLVTALYVLILTYVLLTQYGTWVLMGVVEEKSNRVVEVLLSAVSPLRLLLGKVAGIGTVALAQAATIVAVALCLAAAVGSNLVKGTAPLPVVVGLVWLVLGYAFYCWLFAAIGSLVERQEQVQSVAFPVQLPLLFGYIISFTALGASSPSLLNQVLAYLPPTAPFVMPVLFALGQMAWWEVVASGLVTAAATVGMARLAGTIYRRAILRTGRTVKLKEVLRREAPPLSA
ncbi:MAG TPA: ABC transporter permease [Acidimicrobiales bacterium]|nr:ABC transporter permease [Acidimicrobiales bacterium]